MALVLDGRALAKQIEADLLTRVEALKAKSLCKLLFLIKSFI